MAFREPLNNMLCDETSVHTGLSWARIVLTFCRVWMSHTCSGWGGGEGREHNTLALTRHMATVPVSARGGYSRWWCSLRSRCTACFCRPRKKYDESASGRGLLMCISWCSCLRWSERKNPSVTLVCTVPIRCHRDPRGSSGICRWCRCPTPNGEHRRVKLRKEFRFRVKQQYLKRGREWGGLTDLNRS